MRRAKPGASANSGAASGPAATVSAAPGYRSIRWRSNPVDRTASPIRVAVTNRIFMPEARSRAVESPVYRPGPAACQASASRLPVAGRGAPMTPSFAPLGDRGVLEVAGADRVAFLQGLVSNDAAKAAAGAPVYAALLTAQGKYLHDFFVVALGDALYLDGERARLGDLQRRLSLYKLRSKVTLTDASAKFVAAAAWGDGAATKLGLSDSVAKPFAGGVAYADPRLATLGVRFLIPAGRENEIAAAGFARADAAAYDRHRL